VHADLVERQGFHSYDEAKKRGDQEESRRVRRSKIFIIQELSDSEKNKAQFTQSLEAITMLTEASLTLKKMPKEVMKPKL
jgi:hypothetical protein